VAGLYQCVGTSLYFRISPDNGRGSLSRSCARLRPADRAYVTVIEAATGKVYDMIPESQESIIAKIPASARDDTRLRFKGQGRPGESGEPSGDFYILLRMK
jgi:DnaJ-like protein